MYRPQLLLYMIILMLFIKAGVSLSSPFSNFFKKLKNKFHKTKNVQDNELQKLGIKYEAIIDFDKIKKMSPDDRKKELSKYMSYLNLTKKEQQMLLTNPYLCKMIAKMQSQEVAMNDLEKKYKKLKIRESIIEAINFSAMFFTFTMVLGVLYVTVMHELKKKKRQQERRLIPYDPDANDPDYTTYLGKKVPDFSKFAPSDEEEDEDPETKGKLFRLGMYKNIPYVLVLFDPSILNS